MKAGVFNPSPGGLGEGSWEERAQGSIFMQRNSICEGPELASNHKETEDQLVC